MRRIFFCVVLVVLTMTMILGEHLSSSYNKNRRRRLRNQGRRPRVKVNLTLLPYDAVENVHVEERMNVSLWKYGDQRSTASQVRRGKRETIVVTNSKRRGRQLEHAQKDANAKKAETKEFYHIKTVPRTIGFPWPKPWQHTSDPQKVYVLDRNRFQFVVGVFSQTCATLQQGLRRYYTIITGRQDTGQAFVTRHGAEYVPPVSSGQPPVVQLVEVTVTQICDDGYPSQKSNESYSLEISEQTASLRAGEVWGALRGLETLTQLLYPSPTGQLCVNKTVISDGPRFRHRGVMIDTGRQFLNTDVIKRNLEAMEQNKFNVLHWHLVDDQAFPYSSQALPQLSKMGAYSANETYSWGDIADILEFARRRGIRIIPEIDTPGHTTSWRAGLPHIMADCPNNKMSGVLDPSNNATFHAVRTLWQEVLHLFPDSHVHLGGDEVSTTCWAQLQNMRRFMESKSLQDYAALLSYYTDRLLQIVKNMDRDRTVIFWQDVLDDGRQLQKDSIIQIWRPKPKFAMKVAASRGHRLLYSSPWYLNYISYGRDWIRFYLAEPYDLLADASQWQLVEGGEACMWGEYVDGANLLQTLWPRASAVAERLWSPPNTRNVEEAEMRLEEHRCRMLGRNIPASPMNGPSTCI